MMWAKVRHVPGDEGTENSLSRPINALRHSLRCEDDSPIAVLAWPSRYV